MLEKLWKLIGKIAESSGSAADLAEYVEFVEKRLFCLVDYANCVIHQQIVSPGWRYRLEEEEWLERMEESMKDRNHVHAAAVASMRALNRHCLQNGVEEMFPGIPNGADEDEDVKDAVARAIGLFINEAYNKGIGNVPEWRAFDAAVEGRMEEYDRKQVSALVQEHM